MEIYLPFIALGIAITISILAKREWLGALLFGIFIIPYAFFSKTDITSALVLSSIILFIHAAILFGTKRTRNSTQPHQK